MKSLRRIAQLGAVLCIFGSNVQAHTFNERVLAYSNMRSFQQISSIECLAINAYHEARGESRLSQQMGMATVYNRLLYVQQHPSKRGLFLDKGKDNTICNIVFKKWAYSWTMDKASDKPRNKKVFKRLYKVAEEFILNIDNWKSVSQNATYYYYKGMKSVPKWTTSDKMERVFTVDSHIFYKRK